MCCSELARATSLMWQSAWQAQRWFAKAAQKAPGDNAKTKRLVDLLRERARPQNAFALLLQRLRGVLRLHAVAAEAEQL